MIANSISSKSNKGIQQSRSSPDCIYMEHKGMYSTLQGQIDFAKSSLRWYPLASTFVTPNSKFPWSMKDIIKAIKGHAALPKIYLIYFLLAWKELIIKPRIINKKKACEIIDLTDKLLIVNCDYPKGSVDGIIPVSSMDWIKESFDFYF
jgi:hypothetical protein